MHTTLLAHADASDHDSDDGDYVPPVDPESDEEERRVKRARTGSSAGDDADANAGHPEDQKRASASLWESFQASVASGSHTSQPSHPPVLMVKLEKRFKFAGQETCEVIEVPEDSEDARKWPIWVDPKAAATEATKEATADATPLIDPPPVDAPATAEPPPAPDTPTASAAPKPAGARPGPRKSKLSAPPPARVPKAKKLSTLDRSALDWTAHVSAAADGGVRDELSAHRRGGGYLERVDFLERVGGRKDELLEQSKASKRRRG